MMRAYEKWEKYEVESIVFKADIKGEIYRNRENPSLFLLIANEKFYIFNIETLWASEILPSDIIFHKDGTVTITRKRFTPSHNIKLEVKKIARDKIRCILRYKIGRRYEIIIPERAYIPEQISYETILYGDYAVNFPSPENIVINNKKDWILVWGRIHRPSKIENSFLKKREIPNPPQIDFKKYVVIAVFGGEKKVRGYKIKIDRIVEEKSKVIVYIKEEKPNMRILRTQFSYPFHIVKCKKVNLPITFHYLSPEGPQI